MRSSTASTASLHWLAGLLVLAGCSGAHSNSPLAPGGAGLPTASEPALPLSVAPQGGNLMLGQVHLRVSPEGEVVTDPVRLNQAIGDAWLVGLNELDALCQCFQVTGVTRVPVAGGAEVTLQVEFDHPFPLAGRPDLFGWDLKAILATDDNQFTFPNAALTVPTDTLLNAAGYTEEWTDQIRQSLPALASDAFPYILLGEDHATPQLFDFTNPAGWNVFPSGGTNSGELTLFVPTATTREVDLFFTAGYQVSATRATRQTPDYQPPRGNMRAPFRVDATIVSNDLTPAAGTFATIDLDIWDWQHNNALGSDVTAINVYAPELTATIGTPAIGPETGRGTDPITANFAVNNTLGTFPGGRTYALVEVVDALHQNNPGGTGGAPGVGVVNDQFAPEGTLGNVRTFQVVTLDVQSNLPGVDPVAVVNSTPPHASGVLTISDGTIVNWDASASTDADPPLTPEGTIVRWEWDYEWDGNPVNFIDDTGGTGTAMTPHQYLTIGTTHLGCRAVDGVGRKSAIVDITVNVQDLTLTLVMEPQIDIIIEPVTGNDRRDMGPALAELNNGVMTVNFHSEKEQLPTSPGSYYSPMLISLRDNGTGNWGLATPGLGTSGGSGQAFGYSMKATPAWGAAHNVCTHGFYDRNTGLPSGNICFGGINPMPPYNYGINARMSYNADVVCQRVSQSVMFFEDNGNVLRCSSGGPNVPDLPVFWWWDDPSIPYVVIDARPSVVSTARSTFGSTDGGIYLVYRDVDASQIRFARDPEGDNAGWLQSDLVSGASGDFGDPAFDLDEAGGAVIAYSRFVGGNYELQLMTSNDQCVTWNPPMTAGPTFTSRPMEVSVSARVILGQRTFVIGYSTQPALPSASEIRVRWAQEGGAWTDQLLSAPELGSQPDVLLKRTGNEFYATWVQPRTSVPFADTVVRRGTFQYL